MAVTTMESGLNVFENRSAEAVCRCCSKVGLEPVLDLGRMPLVADFYPADEAAERVKRYPLEVVFCPDCTLVQIIETVPAKELFRIDYPYYSSFAESWLVHARNLAESTIHARGLSGDSLVIELASNDGYLLKNFVERDIPVLGIDPADKVAEAAAHHGVPTLCEFFSDGLAQRLSNQNQKADVIFGLNVLAHSTATNDFASGIRHLLKDDGIVVIEAPYVVDLIDRLEFDTIYHEHLCYFSATSVNQLFKRNGLYLNHVEHVSTHGGSLRLVAGLQENPDESVARFLADEHERGVDCIDFYREFKDRVEHFREQTREAILDLHARGRQIAAYGAAAKGAILLNYLGIDCDVIEFAVDRNVHKQGKLMPGVNIPVYAPGELLERMPDYAIILPWNFKDEIMAQQSEYKRRGGRFVIPIPELEIV